MFLAKTQTHIGSLKDVQRMDYISLREILNASKIHVEAVR